MRDDILGITFRTNRFADFKGLGRFVVSSLPGIAGSSFSSLVAETAGMSCSVKTNVFVSDLLMECNSYALGMSSPFTSFVSRVSMACSGVILPEDFCQGRMYTGSFEVSGGSFRVPRVISSSELRSFQRSVM